MQNEARQVAPYQQISWLEELAQDIAQLEGHLIRLRVARSACFNSLAKIKAALNSIAMIAEHLAKAQEREGSDKLEQALLRPNTGWGFCVIANQAQQFVIPATNSCYSFFCVNLSFKQNKQLNFDIQLAIEVIAEAKTTLEILKTNEGSPQLEPR